MHSLIVLISGVQQSDSVIYAYICMGFPGSSAGKDSVMQETLVQFLGWEDPLEKSVATDSGILGWRILWTEESGGLQSTGLRRVGHD